ncbi:O-antigen ligase family protein [Mucilaginibacter flavus]|uniref:O-antigen ligase family protein n=1 Tax=Mucilaginibacter flavus TaxID=931504 RepID=UPI0025B537EE|nr:O-antigen ligase family protein [Mucilaginibacter flavus]MDN3584468.1 O-antigen ligase family protein [Mucilaginibacter flavus]
MKQLLQINDNNINKISYFHIMLLMASMPFDRFYSHIILISFILHTLINIRKEKLRLMFNIKTLVIQSVFFVSVIATLYTTYRPGAFGELGLRVPVLLFPLVFLFNDLDLKKYRPKLLLTFSFVCTATIVYLYANAAIAIRYYHLPFKTLFSPAFTNHNFSAPIDMHATFFSLQLVIALSYLLTLLFKPLTYATKAFYSFCICILLLGLVQLSSKSILIVLFLLVNIVVPYCLLLGKNKIRFALVALLLSCIAFTVILNVSSFKERYLTSLKDDLSKATPGESTDSRWARWHVVADLIKQKPLVGHGSGSEIPLLQDGFYNAHMYHSFLVGLNSHNQYLSFLVKSGIWGLLIYLLTLGYGLKISLKTKDLVFISFMMLVVIVSLSENMLDADKGVMFYSLFFSFFLLTNNTEIKKPIEANKESEYLSKVATNSLVVTSY